MWTNHGRPSLRHASYFRLRAPKHHTTARLSSSLFLFGKIPRSRYMGTGKLHSQSLCFSGGDHTSACMQGGGGDGGVVLFSRPSILVCTYAQSLLRLALAFLFSRCHEIQWVLYVLGPQCGLPWRILPVRLLCQSPSLAEELARRKEQGTGEDKAIEAQTMTQKEFVGMAHPHGDRNDEWKL